jgi:ABC-type transport system involved in multi-copper enzyme maturation permease subunit
MKTRTLARRTVLELVLTAKGLLWLPAFSLLLSGLVSLFLTNVDLSLMDQKTMMFMTTQAVLLLGMLAVAVVGSDTIAGERDRGTLEALLAAPVTRDQLLGGYLAGALAPWAAMVCLALPYLAVVSAGTGGFLLAAAYLLLAGTVLGVGVAAWTIGVSAGSGSVRNGILMALVIYAGLTIPALLSSALRANWVGRAYDVVDPFSNVLNTLDSVIIDEQGLSFQLVRLLTLAAFTLAGLWYARRRMATLSLT